MHLLGAAECVVASCVFCKVQEMMRYDMPLDAGRVACITTLEARNMQHLLVYNGGQFKLGGTWCLGIL
jgi:hypothetical protein